jgi:hypothetical protein
MVKSARSAASLVSALAVAAAVGSGPTSPAAALDISIGAGPVSVGVSVGVGVGDSSSPAPQEPSPPQEPSDPEPSPEPSPPQDPDQPSTSTPDDDGAGDTSQIPVQSDVPEGDAPQQTRTQARSGQQIAVLSVEDVEEPGPTRRRFESRRTHDGDVRLLAIRDEQERFEALLALVDDCSIADLDLAALVDDRRVTIIDLRDVFEEPAIAELERVLRAGARGHEQTMRAVQSNEELQAVLAREGIGADEVVALQVGESGMTEVFVLSVLSESSDVPSESSDVNAYAMPPMPPPLRTTVADCPVEVEVAALEQKPRDERSFTAPATTGSIGARTTTANIGSSVTSERLDAPVTAEPAATSGTGDGEVENMIARLNDFDDVDAVTEAAAELGVLLDRVAWIDNSLLAVNAQDRVRVAGVVDAAVLPPGSPPSSGTVLSSHALAEAVARLDVPDADRIVTGSTDARVVTDMLAGQVDDQRLAAACAGFLDSLVEDMGSLTMALPAERVNLVPIEGCTPTPAYRTAVITMRALLAADPGVREKLADAGYEESDIVGGSVGDGSELAIYVVN